MAGVPPPSGQQSDNSLAPLWIAALVFVLAGTIWYFGRTYIVRGIFAIKLFEIHYIEYFSHSLDNIKNYMQQAIPDQVTADVLLEICDKVGRYVRYPFMILLAVFGMVLLFRSTGFRFRTTYNMRSLARREMINWPQIAPVMKLDLVKQNLDEGPWAISPSPMAFAKKHKLLIEERKPLAEGMLSRSDTVTVSLNRGAAHRVMAVQVGKPWMGIDKLTPPQKAIFAALLAKAHADDTGARKLLAQVAASTLSGKLNYAGVDTLIKKYAHEKIMKQLTDAHFYILTLFAALLEFARTDGVFATADFLWLKPLDRPLWYMLNSIGRRTVVSEVAGVFAHYLAEKEIGHKLKVPVVEQAVEALELAIKEILYIPEESA